MASDEKIFVDGLIFKDPKPNAPDFVRGSISVNTSRFMDFLEKHTKPDGWVNIDVKESRGGKVYCELSHWTNERPAGRAPTDKPPTTDESPF